MLPLGYQNVIFFCVRKPLRFIAMRLSGRPTGWQDGAADKVGSRYVGSLASEYERVRRGDKWSYENRAVRELLKYVRKGSRILDAPVGTGRLLHLFHARSSNLYGLDASADMLALAKANAKRSGAKVRLQQGDVLSLPYEDEFFDLVVCIRFLNLIGRPDVELAFQELVRVSRDKLLVGIRYLVPASELRRTGLSTVLSRPLWLARRLIRGANVLVQDKEFVVELFGRFGLTVLNSRKVEKTWDGTEYILLLLEKRGSLADNIESRAQPAIE